VSSINISNQFIFLKGGAMRRFGTVTLILFAFVVGFASTYSCGGGSSAEAGGDADTLQGYSASGIFGDRQCIVTFPTNQVRYITIYPLSQVIR